MNAPNPERHGITADHEDARYLAQMVEAALWWQTLAINRLHAAGLTLSMVAAHDVAAANAAREASREMLCGAIEDVARALRLLDTVLPQDVSSVTGVLASHPPGATRPEAFPMQMSDS